MYYVTYLLIMLWFMIASLIAMVTSFIFFKNPFVPAFYGRVFSWGAKKIVRMKVVYEGVENFPSDGQYVFVGNHQNALDMAAFPNLPYQRTVVVGKKELLFIPFFGLFIWASGCILINRSRKREAYKALEKAVSEMKRRKLSVWFFPEGTRNKTEEGMLPFKKGAFHMAILAGTPIVPIVASAMTAVSSKKQKYFRPGTIRVRVLPPIPTTGMSPGDAEDLAESTRQKMLEAFQSISAPGYLSANES